MAQVARERASKRLGIRARIAVAIAGVAVMASLGIFGAYRTHAEGISVARASEQALGEADAMASAEEDNAGEPPSSPEVVVHVDGAVASPGVYRLDGDDVRACDAVDAAGGLLEEADTSNVNLAQEIADGSKIRIPFAGEAEAEASPAGDESAARGINLNTAGLEELMELPGVGEQTAQAILEDRERLGPFASVDDLMRVSGIGEKKLEKIRPYACV